jgi:succinate dehydrogenase / fumarate reductase iron-sulfur subunit
MKLNLRIWRQKNATATGRLVDYVADHVSPDMSFLEMLDVVNEGLSKKGEDTIAFDSDCREGICGMCSLVVNGIPHGPDSRHHGLPAPHAPVQGRRHDHHRAVARARVSRGQGSRRRSRRVRPDHRRRRLRLGQLRRRPDGNTIPIAKDIAEEAMDSAACIGCGACVAACKNASAHLFVSAKIAHLALLPQGQPERYRRVVAMVAQADTEGFGSCSNEGECEAVCPKEIPIATIARMTREYV